MSLELCLELRKCSINVDYDYYMKEFIFLYTVQILHLNTRGLGVTGAFLFIPHTKCYSYDY